MSQPIYAATTEQIMDSTDGICLACKAIQSGCEPDMRKGTCESCGEKKVYGMQEALLMGAITIADGDEEEEIEGEWEDDDDTSDTE